MHNLRSWDWWWLVVDRCILAMSNSKITCLNIRHLLIAWIWASKNSVRRRIITSMRHQSLVVLGCRRAYSPWTTMWYLEINSHVDLSEHVVNRKTNWRKSRLSRCCMVPSSTVAISRDRSNTVPSLVLYSIWLRRMRRWEIFYWTWIFGSPKV